jgi:hypothetical protein
MTGELIIFPVRVSARVARFALRTYIEVTSRAVSLAAQAIRSVMPDGSAEAPERTVPDDVAAAALAATAPAPPSPRAEAPVEEWTPEAPSLRAEPTHVSEEPTVVEEFAEPGAEDGAGAQVHVAEPWPGYAQLTARDVIARISQASREELAAVQLYETAHRQRASVTAAASRELRAKSGRGAATADQSRKEHTDA